MEEYLDVLDKNGNKTGEKKLRKLVHKDGNWHKGIDIAIVNSKNRFLFKNDLQQKLQIQIDGIFPVRDTSQQGIQV